MRRYWRPGGQRRSWSGGRRVGRSKRIRWWSPRGDDARKSRNTVTSETEWVLSDPRVHSDIGWVGGLLPGLEPGDLGTGFTFGTRRSPPARGTVDASKLPCSPYSHSWELHSLPGFFWFVANCDMRLKVLRITKASIRPRLPFRNDG